MTNDHTIIEAPLSTRAAAMPARRRARRRRALTHAADAHSLRGASRHTKSGEDEMRCLAVRLRPMAMIREFS